MKAFLVSDIHGSYRALSAIYEKILSNDDIGMMIFAGDLVDMGEPISFVGEFMWMVERLDIPLFWIPGNNDFGRAYHKLYANFKSLEGSVVDFSGCKFTGVGGSPASWAGQYEGERSVDKKAIAGTIFVSHVPPPGITHYEKFDGKADEKNPNSKFQIPNEMSNDQILKNSKISKTLSLADAPLVHICGHIHHTWGIGYLGSTKVIKLAGGYLGYYAIMDLQTFHVKFERMWQ